MHSHFIHKQASQSHVLLELLKAIIQDNQLRIDVLVDSHNLVDLACESSVFCLLCDHVIFAGLGHGTFFLKKRGSKGII